MASILKVDALQGVTAAGDITITSEGGAVTQSLQQGLAKAYVRFELVGTVSILGSLNISSVEDLAVGAGRPNHTSNMSAADYALVGGNALGGAHAFSEHAAGGLNITSQHRVTARTDTGITVDADMLCSTIFGDLA